MLEVLQPFGDLVNLNRREDRERYAKMQEELKTAQRREQDYRIATNVDMVRQICCLTGRT